MSPEIRRDLARAERLGAGSFPLFYTAALAAGTATPTLEGGGLAVLATVWAIGRLARRLQEPGAP